VTDIDVRLTHPGPDRLNAVSGLMRDTAYRSPLGAQRMGHPLLRAAPPRRQFSWSSLFLRHDSTLVPKVCSSPQPRAIDRTGSHFEPVPRTHYRAASGVRSGALPKPGPSWWSPLSFASVAL